METIDRQHVLVRKGSIINVGLVNEEKGVIENYDFLLEEDVRVWPMAEGHDRE